MNTFEYRHEPSLSQEFVNGSYELGEVQRMNIEGRDILYRLGSALLDTPAAATTAAAMAW